MATTDIICEVGSAHNRATHILRYLPLGLLQALVGLVLKVSKLVHGRTILSTTSKQLQFGQWISSSVKLKIQIFEPVLAGDRQSICECSFPVKTAFSVNFDARWLIDMSIQRQFRLLDWNRNCLISFANHKDYHERFMIIVKRE